MQKIPKNDKAAKWIISAISIVILGAVVILDRHILQVPFPFSFNVHLFAFINAIINTTVAVLLVLGFLAARQRKYKLHKKLMLTSIALSVLFLVSYICHHMWAGDTTFGGGGIIRYFYFFILITHIVLAALILPFILFTAYRGLTGEYIKHKKIARYTFPLWLYVSITGPVIYFMISPYY